MSTDLDLKKLWVRQKAIIPDTKVLLEKAHTFKRRNLVKIIITNILLISTCVFIVFIWIHYQPQMITTKIGIILIVLAVVLFLSGYNQLVPLLTNTNYDATNSLYLQQLLIIKGKQLFIHGKLLNGYFIVLSAGIFIYMIEYCLKMTVPRALFAYGITLAWIAFNWFFMRPRTIKKQQAKINELINRVEELNRQLF